MKRLSFRLEGTPRPEKGTHQRGPQSMDFSTASSSSHRPSSSPFSGCFNWNPKGGHGLLGRGSLVPSSDENEATTALLESGARAEICNRRGKNAEDRTQGSTQDPSRKSGSQKVGASPSSDTKVQQKRNTRRNPALFTLDFLVIYSRV